MWDYIQLRPRGQNSTIKISCFLIWASSGGGEKGLKVKELTVTLALREVCQLFSGESGNHLLP